MSSKIIPLKDIAARHNYPIPYNDNAEVLFRDLISDNEDFIKTFMAWENYDLNQVIIPVVDLIKEHALMILSKSYGKFHVEQTILDELCADVFIYFPVLIQQLGISRLMDAYGVVADDLNTDIFTRTEIQNGEVDQNSELRVGTSNTDTNLLDTKHKTTGTIENEDKVSNTQNSHTSIENVSGVEMTGSRSVNLNHSMPEQAIFGTGGFSVDNEGTPILSDSYVQAATESFNTSNPIDSKESSLQTVVNTSHGTNDSKTSNNITVADSGTTTRTNVNSGKDNSESKTKSANTITVNEKRERLETNKQYAYEIKAFLESADTLVAFSRWEDKFSWVVGII